MLGTAFHHSVIRAPANHAGCPAQAQQIRRLHLSLGYSDWAYNKWVCVHGGSGDMRGWGRISGANGTQWANLNWWAIVALYDGRYDPLTDAMKGAFLREFRAAPQGGNREARPHSAFFATGCPWDPIRDWIASGLGGVVIPGPAPAPQPAPIPLKRGDSDVTVERSDPKRGGNGSVWAISPRNAIHLGDPKQWERVGIKSGGTRDVHPWVLLQTMKDYGVPDEHWRGVLG